MLVKWWLLAIPHYLVLASSSAAAGSLATRSGVAARRRPDRPARADRGVVLLFTGRYPKGLFDLVLGLDRWVLRVAAYVALMTDTYPPFRLDLGGTDPGSVPPAPSGRTARSRRLGLAGA